MFLQHQAKRGFMHVIITETKTARVVTQVEIHLQGLNYTPTEEEYFKTAWKDAVSDGEVEADRYDDYSFTLVP